MKTRLVVLGCLLAAAMAGCTPTPNLQTRTTTFMPASDAGKRCVAQCQQTKQLCNAAVELGYQTCMAEGMTRAHAAYYEYKKHLPKGAKHERRIGDFESEIHCYRLSSCSQDYDECFVSCGGRMEMQTYCVSNCKLMKPPQSDGSKVGPVRVVQ
ncbi:hypothetical protein [Azospirillum palustre]